MERCYYPTGKYTDTRLYHPSFSRVSCLLLHAYSGQRPYPIRLALARIDRQCGYNRWWSERELWQYCRRGKRRLWNTKLSQSVSASNNNTNCARWRIERSLKRSATESGQCRATGQKLTKWLSCAVSASASDTRQTDIFYRAGGHRMNEAGRSEEHTS